MKVYVLQNKRGDVLGVYDTFINADWRMRDLAAVQFGGLHFDVQGNDKTYAGAIGATSKEFSRYDYTVTEHEINDDENVKTEKLRVTPR